jgi:hypothetical protein
MVAGLSNRPAVYPPLLNGRAENFFHANPDPKLTEETRPLFEAITRKLKGEQDGIER